MKKDASTSEKKLLPGRNSFGPETPVSWIGMMSYLIVYFGYFPQQLQCEASIQEDQAAQVYWALQGCVGGGRGCVEGVKPHG